MQLFLIGSCLRGMSIVVIRIPERPREFEGAGKGKAWVAKCLAQQMLWASTGFGTHNLKLEGCPAAKELPVVTGLNSPNVIVDLVGFGLSTAEITSPKGTRSLWLASSFLKSTTRNQCSTRGYSPPLKLSILSPQIRPSKLLISINSSFLDISVAGSLGF